MIELTEHELFAADPALEARLQELRARGARVALDDAGAGYAGLQQLIRVAPDILKIDRSLVHGAHSDGSRYALLEALIGVRRHHRAPPSAARASRISPTCARSPTSTPPTRRATRSPGPPTPWAAAQPRRSPRRPTMRAGVRVASGAAGGGAVWARTLAELGDDLADVDRHQASSPASAAAPRGCSAPRTSR